jgi:hypothetical protein
MDSSIPFPMSPLAHEVIGSKYVLLHVGNGRHYHQIVGDEIELQYPNKAPLAAQVWYIKNDLPRASLPGMWDLYLPHCRYLIEPCRPKH